jgi:hypothetical protein
VSDSHAWPWRPERDYIGYGVRARAQALLTLELGPETELERTAKLVNEVDQERFMYIDRTLVSRSKDGIVVVGSTDNEHAIRQTMRIGRLKKLKGLGLRLSGEPDAVAALRQRETNRLARTLSGELKAVYLPHEVGERVFGVYEGSITTPTGRLAVIRNRDSFTLAPCRPALEPMRGQAVTALIQPHRVTWMSDRGRAVAIGNGT